MADGIISIDVELNEKAFKSSLENMGAIVRTGADLMIKSVGDLSKSFVLMPDTINSVFNSIPGLINGVINNITGKNPVMTKTGTDFFTSLIKEMPDIINKISGAVPEITDNILNKFAGFLPDISNAGRNLFSSLVSDMPEIISEIGGVVPDITKTVAENITKDSGLISRAGYDLFCAIINPLPLAMKEISKAPVMITAMLLEKFNSLSGQFNFIGENIVRGVWAGISGAASWFANSVKSFFQGIIDGVTGFLGISSPSRLFRDLVGKNIVLGIQAGIDGQMFETINNTRTQMTRLAGAAAKSSRLNIGAADIIGRANFTDSIDLQNILKNRVESENIKSVTPEINVTLEPTGDIRGFFDYIRMGVKRSDYLNGVQV